MFNKINKSKGFTLIELMVVIAIISLLSAVVLASLKGAREKAMLTKTVGEMKSLQTALELYRDKIGDYPDNAPGEDSYYDDDDSYNGYTKAGGFNALMQSTLVANKFLSKVPNSPGYPNNCNIDCMTNGYYLGYSRHIYSNSDPNFYVLCGGQKVNSYFMYFMTNSKKINLPNVYYFNNGTLYNFSTYGTDIVNPPYTYCLSM